MAAILVATISLPCLANSEPHIEEYEPEQDDVKCLAMVLYGECRGMIERSENKDEEAQSKAEVAAVAWCVLNRVDDPRWPDTVQKVAKQPHQFALKDYGNNGSLYEDLAKDVLMRWHRENTEQIAAGRTLPGDYFFFVGYSGHNWFRKEFNSNDLWDWSLDNPYIENNKEDEQMILEPIVRANVRIKTFEWIR